MRTLALVGLLLASAARAEIVADPKPPLKWKEMLACESVVVAKYHAHAGATLTLEVVEPLKGAAKAGDRLAVKLEHWYSVETGPVGFDALSGGDKPKGDGVPKLCYKVQIHNPGDAVPAPVLPDVRQAAIYFLPRSATPTLTQAKQVLPDGMRDGWKATLAGKPAPLLFRLLNPHDRTGFEDAVDVLVATRDARVLEELFRLAALGRDDHDFLSWHANVAPMVLATIGDRAGDVYNPAWKAFLADDRRPDRIGTFAPGTIAATADPKRASTDLIDYLTNGPYSFKRSIAFALLGQTGEVAALDYIVSVLKAPKHATDVRDAVGGLRAMFDPYADPNRLPRSNRAVLLQRALKPLEAILADPKIPDQDKGDLKGLFAGQMPEEPLDWAKVRTLLLDEKQETYHGIAGGAAHEMYRRLVRHSDAKAVPILVEVLATVPAARESNAYGFCEALMHYAMLCPNAMRAELVRRNLGKGVGPATKTSGAYEVYTKLYALVGLTFTEEQERWAKGWAAEYPRLPEDPAYWEGVLADLESPELAKRRSGNTSVRRLLCDALGYVPEAPAAARQRAIARLRPLLLQMGTISETAGRALMLREFGVKLEGQASRDWLPTLEKAVADERPGVHGNALRLIEEVAGDVGCYQVAWRPGPQRVAAARAFVADRVK